MDEPNVLSGSQEGLDYAMDLFDKDGLDKNLLIEDGPVPDFDSVRNMDFVYDQDKDIVLGYEFNLTYPTSLPVWV